jgi:hypothetical protein
VREAACVHSLLDPGEDGCCCFRCDDESDHGKEIPVEVS